MTQEIHKHCLKIASGISPDLRDALKQGGAIQFKVWRGQSLETLLYRSVAGQQLSTKAADSIWSRVNEAAGDLPLGEFIRSSDTATLRACGLSGAKVKTLKGIAEAFLAGTLNARKLKRLDTDQRTQALTALWGVGTWTADMVNMFFFGDPDVWPEKDVAVVKTFQRLIGEQLDCHSVAEGFAPYRSYLALYMWRIKDGNDGAW